MCFLVFLRIAYLLKEPKDFISLSLVCRSARKACQHMFELKKWQFDRLFFAYDGESWKIFQNHHDAEEFAKMRLMRGVQLICRGNVYEQYLIFRMRRIELFDLPEIRKCDDTWNCMREFQNK